MSLEQTDFFGKLDDTDQNTNSDSVETETPAKEPKMIQKPDDGLDFNCELCQDVEGGCSSCGFGRDQ